MTICLTFVFVRYQDLAIEARDIWLSWNKHVARSAPSELPNGLTPEDTLLLECGNYFVAAGPELVPFYRESLETMERTAPEMRSMQFVKASVCHGCEHEHSI